MDKKEKSKVSFKPENPFKEKMLENIETKISSSKKMKRYYDKKVERLSIADCISLSLSKEKVDKFILANIYIAAATFLIIFFILKTIWISFIFAMFAVYINFYLKIKKLNKKMAILEYDFPECIQVFFDEYMVSRNVRSALTHISEKSKGSTGLLFETMTRKMYSGEDPGTSIDEMAATLDIFYAYAFAEILKLSLTDVGDISKEIGSLIELMQDDIEEREKTKSELHENKAMFFLLNGITAVVFVINIFVHPYAKEIYAYTIKGNFLIVFWIMQIIGGLAFIDLNEKI